MYALAPAPCLAPVQSSFEIGGRRFETTTPGLAKAIAAAHAAHRRPRCLCRPAGVEMYVARLGGGYIVKRMPNTGGQHAPGCRSYEPLRVFPDQEPGAGPAAIPGAAAIEESSSLHVPLPVIPRRDATPVPFEAVDRVTIDGTSLSLLDLLHGLWAAAELTHWRPGFAGKRSWATVRRRLLATAAGRSDHAAFPHVQLYIPEVFTVEHQEAAEARRIAAWTNAIVAPGSGQLQQRMLLIAELKAIVPTRHGYLAIFKHLPSKAFALDERLYHRMGRCFAAELILWGAVAQLHMVVIADLVTGPGDMSAIAAMALMPVSSQWLPVHDAVEHQRVERFVREGRAFVRSLQIARSPCGWTVGSMTVSRSSCFRGPSPQGVRDEGREPG